MALRDWLTRDLSPKEDKADVVFMPREEKERLRLRLISASDGMIDGLATCLQQAQLIDRAREQLFSMLDSVEIGSISQCVGNSSSCGTDNVKRIIDTEISHLFKASLYRTATELVPVFIWAANIDMINKDLEDAKEKIRAGRKASMETYAVIGAMATTGGDAEEAARILGVTVDYINERF